MPRPGTWEHWIDQVITRADEEHSQPKIWNSEEFLEVAKRAYEGHDDPVCFTDCYINTISKGGRT